MHEEEKYGVILVQIDEIYLPTQSWTRKAVVRLMKKNVIDASSIISELLSNSNPILQKFIYKATQRNGIRRENQLQKKYRTIKKRAKKTRRCIGRSEEMGVYSTHVLAEVM